MYPKIFRLIFLLIQFSIFTPPIHVFGKSYNMDSSNRFTIKVDLAADYYTLFDTRQQLRLNVELAQQLSRLTFTSYCIDIGLYDHYNFTKYYDILNQEQGLYSVNKKVVITGFHLMPGYNTFLVHSQRKYHQGIFVGILSDISLYRKHFESYNTLSVEKYTINSFQFKAGLGVSAGLQISISRKLLLELKTNLITKVIHYNSQNDANEIPVLHAQWSSNDHQFWWMSNLKIGYEL